MKTDIGILKDQEIIKAFGNTHTSYSLADRRHLLEKGVLDSLAGYASGYMLTQIMKELKLINNSGQVLIRGRYFIHNTYR